MEGAISDVFTKVLQLGKDTFIHLQSMGSVCTTYIYMVIQLLFLADML